MKSSGLTTSGVEMSHLTQKSVVHLQTKRTSAAESIFLTLQQARVEIDSLGPMDNQIIPLLLMIDRAVRLKQLWRKHLIRLTSTMADSVMIMARLLGNRKI